MAVKKFIKKFLVVEILQIKSNSQSTIKNFFYFWTKILYKFYE